MRWPLGLQAGPGIRVCLSSFSCHSLETYGTHHRLWISDSLPACLAPLLWCPVNSDFLHPRPNSHSSTCNLHLPLSSLSQALLTPSLWLGPSAWCHPWFRLLPFHIPWPANLLVWTLFWSLLTICNRLNVYTPSPTQTHILEILTAKVMILASGSSGRWSGYEGGASEMGLVPLSKAPQSDPSVSEEECCHQTPNLPGPRSWTAQPPEPWEMNACCLQATQRM